MSWRPSVVQVDVSILQLGGEKNLKRNNWKKWQRWCLHATTDRFSLYLTQGLFTGATFSRSAALSVTPLLWDVFGIYTCWSHVISAFTLLSVDIWVLVFGCWYVRLYLHLSSSSNLNSTWNLSRMHFKTTRVDQGGVQKIKNIVWRFKKK